jgi:hypothetical protein
LSNTKFLKIRLISRELILLAIHHMLLLIVKKNVNILANVDIPDERQIPRNIAIILAIISMVIGYILAR